MTEQKYIPAMGRHGALFLYVPLTRLAGLPRVHGELLDRAGVRPEHRVLEIGCGPGDLLMTLARRVPGVDALGIDPDPDALRRARRKAARKGLTVRFERAFAGALPLPDGSVDRVLSSYMLHHLGPGQELEALREVARVLRPDGSLHLVDAYGKGRRGPEEVLESMRAAGLGVVAENGRGHRAGLLGNYAFYRAGAPLPSSR
jgi:ubiquinone/menaquinone biosynthesis C-methylase UbiE